MRRDSITTLQDLDDRDLDVRAWCWTCARGATIAIHYIRRFTPLTLAAAARRFPCLACGTADQVALYPATRRHKMPSAAADAPRDPDRVMTAADMVAAIYFGARKAAKQAKRDAAIARAGEDLRAAIEQRKAPPKRVPTKPPKLRLVGTPKQ